VQFFEKYDSCKGNYGTKDYGDFTIIHYPTGSCCFPSPVNFWVKYKPTNSSNDFWHQDRRKHGGVAEQKKEKFGYPEGFKKSGLAQYHFPSFGYLSRNHTPPDALFAPEHNFRHALGVNPNFPVEGVYGREYGRGAFVSKSRTVTVAAAKFFLVPARNSRSRKDIRTLVGLLVSA
jgi:hypothetical protein